MEEFKKIAIIDGDTIPWIIGYNHKDSDIEGMVINAVDSYIETMLAAVKCDGIIGYLGNPDKRSIRRELVSTYKSNRPEVPEWYVKWADIINNHLVNRWKFNRSVSGYEADDMVACATAFLKEKNVPYIICGTDKDLKQIEGEHFSFTKGEFSTIDAKEANKRLALQCLTGDSTDGIKGIPGTGPKTAEKILAEVPEDVSLFVACLSAYISKYGESEGVIQFYQNYMQVKLHIVPDAMENVLIYKISNSRERKQLSLFGDEIVDEGTDYDVTSLFKAAS